MKEELRDRIKDEGLVTLDGFDSCIIGIIEGCVMPSRVCYSYDKIIAQIILRGCTCEDAVDYFDYNVSGGYLGPTSPCFLVKP